MPGQIFNFKIKKILRIAGPNPSSGYKPIASNDRVASSPLTLHIIENSCSRVIHFGRLHGLQTHAFQTLVHKICYDYQPLKPVFTFHTEAELAEARFCFNPYSQWSGGLEQKHV
jgi:hypothetical protein